jgi:hypothetical protein
VIPATLRRWSAWGPGLEDEPAWRRWAAEPRALEGEERPQARFLPALLRRRCSPLARVMLSVAYACCGDEERGEVASVFASRHGNLNESIDLFERLVRRQPLSPTRFSHTVHNAQAGLFSIAAGNRCASSSVSAQEDSFACGFLEALTLLQRAPTRPVLLVMADVPLASPFAPLVDEPATAYGLALLLATEGTGDSLAFALEHGEPEPARPVWPSGLEFLRWLLSQESRLELRSGARRWVWERR